MFDDKSQDNVNPPGNLPIMPTGNQAEPEDIFSGVEKDGKDVEAMPLAKENVLDNQSKSADALSSGKLVKKEPVIKTMPDDLGNNAQELNQISNYKVSEPILGKVFMVFIILIVVVAVIVGGWWVYTKFFKSDNQEVVNTVSTVTNTEVNIVTPPKVTNTPKQADTKIETTNTSTQIKTQINNDNILFGEGVDTDKDGLDDIREAQLKTDPSKSDTDGDELSDGDEVLYWKTDPLKADTDGDTFLDGREIKFGYNPLGAGKLTDMLKTSTSTGASTSTN